MDANTVISGLQNLAGTHPYLILGLIMLIIALAVDSKAIKIVFVLLALAAFLKEFSLFDAFLGLLKSLPTLIKDVWNAFGGG